MTRHLLAAWFIAWFATAGLADTAFDPIGAVDITGQPGAQVPMGRALVSAHGEPTTLAEIADGKPLLLVPVQHDCPNICGVTLTGLAQALAVQPYAAGTDFHVVAFGIDAAEPASAARNTVTELGARFPELARAGGLRAVVGDEAAIGAVTEAVGYRYAWDEQLGQFAHAAAVAVLTPDGRLARWLYGVSPDPTDLRLALTEAGEGRIGDIADQLLLLCYRYDPETGRYGSLVWGMLRAGGVGVVAALAGFVALSVLRDRRRKGPGA